MKKILAMVLAMMLVLSMSAAFAEETTSEDWVSEAKSAAITMKKIYELTGSTDASLYPAETLEFSVKAAETNPDDAMITVDDLTVTGNTNQIININLPVYDTVGVYEYTITEDEGDSQAVTYTDAAIDVKVLVSYNYEESKLDAEIVLNSKNTETGAKIDTFTNEYEVGHLTVKKTIEGNLASDTQYFKFTVTFNTTEGDYVNSDITVSETSYEDAQGNKNLTNIEKGWTDENKVEFYLKAEETITFSNIPTGVTYTVDEDNEHAKPDTIGNDSSKGYTVSGEVTEAKTIAEGTATETINNKKEASVETGISLDNAPYMILMALVVVAGAALIVKRASANR